MLAAAILVCMAIYVDAHGAMIWPRPRSSHNQTLDAHNKCGAKDPYNKHGQTGPGEYCGAGCIGESCLYYQIGCFHSCATCSYEGKTLWPVENDLVTAGCSTNPPPPTLGGGDPAKAYALRTHNRDLASTQGDWTQWNPWRSPGSTGKGNPGFQPCGVNSGSKPSFPLPPAQGQPAFANGTDLPPLPPSAPKAQWKSGSVVEASWAIYANHGGGYAYRLCKKVEGKPYTEECYQQGHLEFATDTTQIRYIDGPRNGERFFINATTTSEGTYPANSQWRKNPIPMCNCDLGFDCSTSPSEESMKAAWPMDAVQASKKCTAVTKDKCPTSGYNACMKCGGESSYDCEECCPGFKQVTMGQYKFCMPGSKPGPKPGPADKCAKGNADRSCMFKPYPKSYKPKGHDTPLCPSGLQFPAAWPEGYSSQPTQNMQFEMVDKLKVPQLEAGEYSLSWRWDCEETPQVWNSCADISITA